MASNGNSGVQVGGHATFHAGNSVVGSDAVQNITYGGALDASADLRKQVGLFLRTLAEHKSALPEHEEVAEAATALSAEAAREKPNRLTLRSLLDGITTSVRSVSGMAAALEALRVAVHALLH